MSQYSIVRSVPASSDDVVNVKSYGAVGDGVTNDASALNAAIQAAVTAEVPMFLPAGAYFRGSTTLVTPATANGKLRILGAGKGVTRIVAANGVANTSIDCLFTGSAVLEISDLTIEGPTGLTPDNNSIGINWITGGATLTKRLRVERVQITGTHDHGILSNSGGRVEVIDVDFSASDVCCAVFESTGAAVPGSVLVRGGTWDTTAHYGVGGSDSVGLYIHPHIPYRVIGTTFKDINRYAIYQNGTPSTAREYAVAVGISCDRAALAQTKPTGLSTFSGCSVQGHSGNASGNNLSGEVLISGTTFDDAETVQYGVHTPNNVTLVGCLFKNTRVISGGDAASTWAIRSCKFLRTDEGTMGNVYSLWTASGKTFVSDVLFEDATTSLVYPGFINTVDATVLDHVKTRGTFRGATGCIRAEGVANLVINDCDMAGTLSIANGAPGIKGNNNFWRNNITGFSTDQHQMVRRPGISPVSLASGDTLNLVETGDRASHDTFLVTGSATINTFSGFYVFVGRITLIAAAGSAWSLGSSGNIVATGGARAVNSVVQLLWEPTVGKWLEVA